MTAVCLLVATVAPAAPEVAFKDRGNWAATVDEIKKFLQLAPDQRPTQEEQNLQLALLEAISRFYPLEFDWVIQDLEDNLDHIRDFYFRRTPEIERKMLEKVFAGLGRDCPEVSRSNFLATYREAAAERRQQRLAGLQDHCRKIVFVKHFNLGGSHYAYTEALSDAQGQRFFVPGGALCVYDVETGKVETLLSDEDGVIRDPDVSFDGKRILFAWKKSDREDDYHLYEMDYASREVRQITHGLGFADYEGIYLPDGDILFSSTRCIQTTDCWTTEVSNIYRCDKEGKHLRRLGFDQVATVYPKLMSDGRVTYTRWEYMDRGQVFPQPLFQMNPDGTGQTEYYGNNSWFPTSILHARGIPGSHKVIAISSGHHTIQSGKLIEIDRTRGLQENTGVDYLNPRRPSRAVRVDACDRDGTQYQYPYPLSERDALVTISPATLRWVFGVRINMCRWPPGKRSYDLYFINTETDARELLYRDPELSSSQPIPLRARPGPHRRPSPVDYKRQEGAYYMLDVYVGPGLEGVPRGTIKKLRVIALDWRLANVGANWNFGPSLSAVSMPVSIHNGSWEPKYILGETPVHEDGSVYFKVPARTPVYFQCIDEDGRAVQTMRSWSTLQPGEVMGCVGCHENKNEAPAPDMVSAEAFRAGSADLEPFYDIRRGFSFVKDIQPILDKHCVECHRPGGKSAKYLLTGDRLDDPRSARFWTRSYLTLTQYGHPNQYITWVHAQSPAPMIPPHNVGSAASPIFALLADHHGVSLSREELDKFAAWIDLAVPFSQGYIDQNAFDEKQMAQFEQFFNKRKYCELMERRAIEDFVREKQGAEDFRMPRPVPFDDPPAPGEIYRDILADEGVKREQGMVAPEAAASEEAAREEVEEDTWVAANSRPHYAWTAEFPAEMSFDRLDVILDAKSLDGAFPVAATLEFADGSATQVAIAQRAVRQSFYIERHDSKSLKIHAPRRLIADFELFGRTKTDLFDREKNVERRKDMPKYEVKNPWELRREHESVHPPNLFQTLDQWRATQPHVRLTELEPLKAATGHGAPGIGKSAGGGPFSVAGKRYYDGIGVHAKAELVYACRPEWRKFVATVGIDDTVRPRKTGSIVCHVIAEDTAGKKQTLAKSPVLQSGKQEEHHFDVPLPAGTAKLHLVVDDAGDGANCDHADWVNAGFRKK